MQVDQVDFVSVRHVTWSARSRSTGRCWSPGERVQRGRARDAERDARVLGPEADGEPFQANTAGVALRVADVEAAVEEFRAAGGEVIGIEDSGSATWASSRISTATCSSFTDDTRRRRSVARAELLERYRALPMPTTTDESWRFTDLKGFDPDAFVQNGHVRRDSPWNNFGH